MKKENSTNSLNKAAIETVCPMMFGMEQIKGRWKILILWYLSNGDNRFGKLQKRLLRITTKMLTQQLRELEGDNFLTRTIFPEVPPRVEYALTAKGKSLIPILKELYSWGKNQKKKELSI